MAAGNSRNQTFTITFVGVMAALCFVSNYIRIPLGESSVHIGNAVCLLCGLLFGPVYGFLSAGIGNFLYDIMAGYGAESLITLVSKGAIALVGGAIAISAVRKDKLSTTDQIRIGAGCVLGSLTYVVLYMLKTFIKSLFVQGFTMEVTQATMLAKLPASMINAVFAMIAGIILINGLRPAMKHLGVIKALQ